MADAERKTCFMIAPIGKDGTDTRKRSNQCQSYACNPTSTVLRSSNISSSGSRCLSSLSFIFIDLSGCRWDGENHARPENPLL